MATVRYPKVLRKPLATPSALDSGKVIRETVDRGLDFGWRKWTW
jgi:hypothetical protein